MSGSLWVTLGRSGSPVPRGDQKRGVRAARRSLRPRSSFLRSVTRWHPAAGVAGAHVWVLQAWRRLVNIDFPEERGWKESLLGDMEGRLKQVPRGGDAPVGGRERVGNTSARVTASSSAGACRAWGRGDRAFPLLSQPSWSDPRRHCRERGEGPRVTRGTPGLTPGEAVLNAVTPGGRLVTGAS